MTTLPDGISIRTIADDELERWGRQVARQFGEGFHAENLEFVSAGADSDPTRTIGLFDGDRLVGTGLNFTFRMTVPGGAQLGCAGVSGIGVQTTHRRRGFLRALMRTLLDDARERGEPLASLLASESGIYGRFGFGPAINVQRFEVRRPYARLVDRVDEHVELVDRDAEALQRIPPIYERAQARRIGMLSRPPWWWEPWSRQDPEHERDGFSERYRIAVGDRGYATYRIKAEWDDTGAAGILNVEQLIAADAVAEAALWQFCFDVDLVTKVTARRRPLDDPLPLMVPEPVRVLRTIDEPFYLRLLDVPAALQARSYATEERLALAVEDPFYPDNSATWLLEAERGGVQCERTGRTPDLELDVQDLGSVYLGGVSWSQLVRARRVREVSPGAAGRADAMFRVDPLPWQPWGF